MKNSLAVKNFPSVEINNFAEVEINHSICVEHYVINLDDTHDPWVVVAQNV
jgi:hypothetical protein